MTCRLLEAFLSSYALKLISRNESVRLLSNYLSDGTIDAMVLCVPSIVSAVVIGAGLCDRAGKVINTVGASSECRARSS